MFLRSGGALRRCLALAGTAWLGAATACGLAEEPVKAPTPVIISPDEGASLPRLVIPVKRGAPARTEPIPAPSPSPAPSDPLLAPQGGPEQPGPTGPGTGLAGGLPFDAAGYIDSAIPRTQLRLRYDSAYN